MSSTVEQETDDMTLTEAAPVIEGCGLPDDSGEGSRSRGDEQPSASH